jgi:hypothetical protein
MTLLSVLAEVHQERSRQDAKWGEQNHPDGTGITPSISRYEADVARSECDTAFAEGRGTYKHILLEEVYEALAESDKAKLRTELIQVAAVATAWVEKLDREAA